MTLGGIEEYIGFILKNISNTKNKEHHTLENASNVVKIFTQDLNLTGIYYNILQLNKEFTPWNINKKIKYK